MSQESIKLREERAALVARAREINDKALAESRDLTDEERTNYDKAMSDVADLGDRIKSMETREKDLAAAEADLEAKEKRSVAPDLTAGAPGGAKPDGTEKRDVAQPAAQELHHSDRDEKTACERFERFDVKTSGLHGSPLRNVLRV